MKHIINFSDFHMHFFKDFSKPDPEYGTDRAKEQITILDNLMSYARNKMGMFYLMETCSINEYLLMLEYLICYFK